MSDYTKTTNFTTKDNLTTGNALKVIKGSYFDTEFDNLATHIATKYDSGNLASQAEAEAEASNTVLMTPLRTANWADANAGIVGDLQALADPGADKLLGWDESANNTIGFTLGAGLSFSTTTLNLASAVAGTGMTMSSQVLNVIGGDGITANANDIAVSSSIAGTALTFSSGVINASSASTTAAGIAERATQAEVDAGTDTTRYISPATLESKPNNNTLCFCWTPPDVTRTLTNQSTALTFFLGVDNYRTKIDLSTFTQVRLISHVVVAGFAGSYHEVRYATTFATAASSYLTLGSSAVRITHDTATAMEDTGWINLVAGAKIDNAFLALVVDDGNDTADPSIEQVTMYFR